ncbi:uncharacterized protein [Drosophila takahashii]|uniref:uncharacterized protein n=1 Tax=Drosophila takahashii TaxID=29030 RepID=UPI001CF8967C|nr:uncharacterized protein LOC108058388 [Drosophila takahashii]
MEPEGASTARSSVSEKTLVSDENKTTEADNKDQKEAKTFKCQCRLSKSTIKILKKIKKEKANRDQKRKQKEKAKRDKKKGIKVKKPKKDPTAPRKFKSEEKAKQFCEQQQAELRWKTFTDAEFADWRTFKNNDYKVPLRSVFSYLKVPACPMAIRNEPAKPTVSQVMAELLKSNQGATTRVKIGEQRFKCIPNLLRCYSVWFANRDWRMQSFRFEEREVPARGFAALYEWMRTEQLPEVKYVVQAMQAARHLGVRLCEKDCWQVLSREEVREKRAFLVFQEAKRLPALAEVCESMLGRLRNCFLALVGSSDFLELEGRALAVILRQDTLGVNSEMEVFFAVLRWLGHADAQRRIASHLRRLMSCVRFHHMPLTFLFSLRESMNRADKDELFRPDPVLLAFHRDPETMALLEQAMSFIGLRSQCENTDELFGVCNELGIDVVFPRQWVYHPACPYHLHPLTFPYQHRFTATEFGEYIASIQEQWIDEGPADHGKSLVLDLEKEPLLRRQREWLALQKGL